MNLFLVGKLVIFKFISYSLRWLFEKVMASFINLSASLLVTSLYTKAQPNQNLTVGFGVTKRYESSSYDTQYALLILICSVSQRQCIIGGWSPLRTEIIAYDFTLNI